MRRVSGPISRCLAAAACAVLISTSALAVPASNPAKPRAAKTVPITIPLSVMPVAGTAWSPADERYEARRHWKRHRHNDGIDGGDLLGGLLVLGGIAAVAAAIDKSGDEQRARRDGESYPQRAYDYRGDQVAQSEWRGRERSFADEQDRAVEACSAEAAGSGQVDEIHAVEWLESEWRVRGDYQGGGGFTCSVDGNGKAYVGMGDQARNDMRDTPGGEDDPDDRYATAQSPDFADPRGR